MLSSILRAPLATLLTFATLSGLDRADAQSTMRATRVASGLVMPVGAFAPAGDFNRLFILELASAGSVMIRILDLTAIPPVLSPTPYLTITPISTGGEEGLLGLAFHPNFASNGALFVCYTDTSGDVKVVRYQANAPFSTANTADAASATEVLTIPHPAFPNHNGGWIGFGPDGFLYICAGEGNGSAQSLATRLGKVLRVDVDADDFPADTANNYAIPPGNPFSGSATALPEIWHYGLRNPWRASFDRATGDLWIGDVGDQIFEEINFVPAGQSGRNFGWGCMEGFICTQGGQCVCNDPGLTLPVYAYSHTSGNACIIGGYRYRGSAMCSFQGLYFYGDFSSSRIWTAEWNGSGIQNRTERTAELAAGGGPPISLITSFGEDAAGELYVCDVQGDVFRIEPGTIVDCNQNGVHDSCDLARGTSHDWNGNGLIDDCEALTGLPYCFGDGTTPTACPCGNVGAVGRGCNNSALTGGARLEAVGDPLRDEVVLISSGELPSATTIFLQTKGHNAIGFTFGDGVRCAGGAFKRLYVTDAVGGVAHAPALGDASIITRSNARGDPISALSGQVRYYQAFYYDPDATYCAAPLGNIWNASSMLKITW